MVMRIAPRATLCANDWRVHADESGVRFEELRELCALVGDKTSLAIGMPGRLGWHAQRGQVWESERLASELMTLLDSISDPSLTATAGFSAIGIKAQAGEMGEVLRWSQATVEWTKGDPTKGNLIVGSPLAVALSMRGLARAWFGHPGWREDLDDAVAVAEQSGEPFTLAMVLSGKYGMGIWNRALCADDAAVRMIESALHTVEASGDNYAVVMVENLLACTLLNRSTEEDREPGLKLLAHTREVAIQWQHLGSELSIIDVYFAREQARGGDRDGAIPILRKSVDDMIAWGQLGYYIPAIGVLVETLLSRGAEGDLAEAGAVIASLAAAPAEGSVIRDAWLLRLRALLARARGDEASYRDHRDRYCALATSLGFEGHMVWAEEMP
jgi:hypothetical protein